MRKNCDNEDDQKPHGPAFCGGKETMSFRRYDIFSSQPRKTNINFAHRFCCLRREKQFGHSACSLLVWSGESNGRGTVFKGRWEGTAVDRNRWFVGAVDRKGWGEEVRRLKRSREAGETANHIR